MWAMSYLFSFRELECDGEIAGRKRFAETSAADHRSRVIVARLGRTDALPVLFAFAASGLDVSFPLLFPI